MSSLSRNATRAVLGATISVVCALAIAACGSDDSSESVAVVDGQQITKAQFDRVAEITARSMGGEGEAIVPDPPSFERCVEALGKQKPPRGQSRPTADQLRAQCRQRWEQIVQQAMTSLLQTKWIEDEAKQQDISATDAEVRREFETTKRQSFPSEADFQRFLRQSGMTQEDALDRVRSRVLANKITARFRRDVPPVTQAEIAAYYKGNRRQFKGQTLAEARGLIRQQLAQQVVQKRILAFAERFSRSWTAKTRCSEGYAIELCSNGPKPKTTTSSGGGAGAGSAPSAR